MSGNDFININISCSSQFFQMIVWRKVGINCIILNLNFIDDNWQLVIMKL